jgi:DNA-binding NarL/FixJ family response regulator
MINIAIADDEILFRQGLAALLETYGGFRIMHQAEDGSELLTLLKKAVLLPDIILLDLRMKPLNGIDTARLLKEQFPETKVIILSSFYQPAYLSYMVKLGVNAFLPKNCGLENLALAIKKVIEKGLYFSEEDILHLREAINKRQKPIGIFKSAIHLTSREKEVLELICKEYSTPEIADKLFLSVRTVEGHRNNLLLKTGSKNTVGLVIYAVSEKVIDFDKKLIELSLQ